MIKAAVILLIVTGVGASVAWGVHIIRENEQLYSELAIQQNANSTFQTAIAELDAINNETALQVIAKDKQNRLQNIRLRKMQNKLDKQLEAVTNEEKVCLHSIAPTAIIDFLRVKKTESSD